MENRNSMLFRNKTNYRANTFKSGDRKSRVELEAMFFTVRFVGLFVNNSASWFQIKMEEKKNGTSKMT